MANMRVSTGPSNGELLFLQESEHSAKFIFDHRLGEKKELVAKRSDQRLWSFIKQHPIPDRVMNYIRVAGFGGVFDCGYKLIDSGLITALVERWRPETHTFHLPFGEVTVTLQDVQVLWGLQVEGLAVTGKEVKWNDETMNEKCVQLLGYAPMAGDLKGAQMKTSFLHHLLQMGLPDDASELACVQRARVYILYLLTGTLFPDKSDGYTHLYLLRLIEDINRCSNVSWGSAVLAFLYRNLCKATSPDANDIGGPLMLLQLWAWCRLPCTSPILPQSQLDFEKPYGARWRCPLSFKLTTAHMLLGYRSTLHALNDDKFIWTPYDDVLTLLPEVCRSNHDC